MAAGTYQPGIGYGYSHIDGLMAHIATQVLIWEIARGYTLGLMSGAKRKNGWQLADRILITSKGVSISRA